jgi:hypothetical protein
VSRKASCDRQRVEDKENSGNAFLLMERGQLSLRRWVGGTPIYTCHCGCQDHVVPPQYAFSKKMQGSGKRGMNSPVSYLGCKA